MQTNPRDIWLAESECNLQKKNINKQHKQCQLGTTQQLSKVVRIATCPELIVQRVLSWASRFSAQPVLARLIYRIDAMSTCAYLPISIKKIKI